MGAVVKRAFLITALSTTVAACTAGADYGGPPSAGSATVARGTFRSASQAAPASVMAARWWDGLGDAELTRLIDRALANAPDIDIALARVEQAQAHVDRSRGANSPRLAASAAAAGLAASEAPAPTLLPGRHTFAAYDADLQAGWELDLFGRGRRQREAATARHEAAVASLADTQVMLSAAVAQQYLAVRAAEADVQLARRRVDQLSEIDRLNAVRIRGGSMSADDAAQSGADRDMAKGRLALQQAELVAAENDLAALIGVEPGELQLPPGEAPLPPAEVQIADPGAVLRNRPDIRVAERTLAAKSADHALAVAEKFPRISLMGILGMGGARVDRGLTAPSLLGLAMPRLSIPIFDGGQIKAGIKAASAAQDEAAANYRKTVLSALRDCDTALARFGAQRVAYAQTLAAEDAARRLFDITAIRYKAGSADALNTQRAALKLDDARRATLSARIALTAAYVTVMKSMGLGWQASGKPAN